MQARLITGVLFAFSFFSLIRAQPPYQLASELTEFSVSGTSTLHDWTMTLDKGKSSGEASFTVEGNKLTGVDGLAIKVASEGLKSGKAQMDQNTYNALKTEEHPHILFEMGKVQNIEEKEGQYHITADGKLTIAGNARDVDLKATCAIEDAQVTCSGSHPIKLTDFSVDPPSAMFGTIKTGDDITINYRAVFSR